MEPDRPDVDRTIRAALDDAARVVNVEGSDEMLATVRDDATRRTRRRRRSVGGVATLSVLAFGAATFAVVGGAGDSDRLVTEASDEAPLVTDAPASTSVQSGSDSATDDGAGSPAQPVPSPTTVVDGAGGQVTAEVVTDDALASAGSPSQLFAWNGGFLSVTQSIQPQPLPDQLPEDIASRFPPEVLDLFPDGLPPTLDEATAILQEAGLYDQVVDIVLSDPEVSEVIYSERPDMIVDVRFSSDGLDWTELDVTLPSAPSGGPAHTAVVGDRFVMALQEFDDGRSSSAIEIHSSSDLVEWDVQTIEVSAEPSRPGYSNNTWLMGVTGDSDRWLVAAQTSVNFDPAGLATLPADVVADMNQFGYSADSDGLVVERYDESTGESLDRRVVSWDELGIEAPDREMESGRVVGFAAAWGGPVDEVVLPGQFSQLAYAGGHFLGIGETVQVSPDARTWTDLPLPTPGYVTWVLDTGDGALVSIGDGGSSARFLLDTASLTWAPVDIPGLPSSAELNMPATGSAIVLVDWNQPPYVEPASIVLSGSNDSYRIELTIEGVDGQGAASYELIAVATGEVVASEETDDFESGGDVFSSLTFTDDGAITATDPSTGEVLLDLDSGEFDFEELDAAGQPIEREQEAQELDLPDMWVVASVDGDIVAEPVDGDGWVSSAAVQGKVVLVAAEAGRFIRLER